MRFVIDGEKPKEEICKVSLCQGFGSNEVRIIVENSKKKFNLATLKNGKIYLDSGFNAFDGIEANEACNPLVVASDGVIINA